MLNFYQKKGLVGASILALIVVAIGFGFYYFAPSYQSRLIYSLFVNLIVVVGLQTFMGNANLTSFSHSAFMGIAAYAAAICVTPVAMKAISLPDAPWGLNEFQLNAPTSALIALLIVLVLALLTGLFIARLNGVGVTIVSIALLVIVHSIFLHRTDIFKGNQAFFGIPQVLNLPVMTFITAGMIIVARLFRESQIGLQLRASADDEIGARALGISIFRTRLIAWVVSALFFAVAGICYAFYLGTISARPFYFHYVFLTVAMLILGGLRSVSGAVLGTLLISLGLELIRWLETGPTIIGVELPQMLGLSGLLLGMVIIGVMIWFPNGLCGTYEVEDIFTRKKRENTS